MKKLLVLISLFSVSCAFGMNPNASDGKQEANDDQPTAAARASAPASAAATAPIDHAQTGEETVTLTFADNEDATRELKLQYANCAQTLNDLFGDFGGAAATPTTIPFNKSIKDFDLLAPYWEPVFQISIALDDHAKAEYTKQLIEQLFQVTDKAQLGTIITGADYLGIQSLVDCGLHVASEQLVTEIDFNNFMDEEALKNYNPYNLNHDLNSQLAALIIGPLLKAYEFTVESEEEAYPFEISNQTVIFGKIFTCESIIPQSSYDFYDFDGVSIDNIEVNHPHKRGYCTLTKHDGKPVRLQGEIRQQKWGHLRNCVISPNKKLIATFHYLYIHIWDINGNLLCTIDRPTEWNSRTITGCFNYDSTRFLAIWNPYDDKINSAVVGMYEPQNGVILKTLKGHTDWIQSATFSPDGQTVLTASPDNTAKLWDTQTGICIGTLNLPPGGTREPVSRAPERGYFSQDGREIMTISRGESYTCKAILWKIERQKFAFTENFTLPQALLLRFALHKKGISLCIHNAAYKTTYNSFSPEMQTFIAPLIRSEHCGICLTTKRLAWAGAAAAAGWLVYKTYQWYRK